MVSFIEAHRATYGVEPICAVLPIAPSTYWWHRTRHTDPTQRSQRAHRDETLRAKIQRIWNDNEQVYGAEKVWRQLRRDGPSGGALHGRAFDAPDGPARRRAWTCLDHHHASG